MDYILCSYLQPFNKTTIEPTMPTTNRKARAIKNLRDSCLTAIDNCIQSRIYFDKFPEDNNIHKTINFKEKFWRYAYNLNYEKCVKYKKRILAMEQETLDDGLFSDTQFDTLIHNGKNIDKYKETEGIRRVGNDLKDHEQMYTYVLEMIKIIIKL